MEGGHTQHIRERFLPPFGPGFWDGVGFLLIVGLSAHKHPKCGMSVGLGQVDASIKHYYHKEEKPSLPESKEAKALNFIFDQFRNHAYTCTSFVSLFMSMVPFTLSEVYYCSYV
jgi:hypothetical protein